MKTTGLGWKILALDYRRRARDRSAGRFCSSCVGAAWDRWGSRRAIFFGVVCWRSAWIDDRTPRQQYETRYAPMRLELGSAVRCSDGRPRAGGPRRRRGRSRVTHLVVQPRRPRRGRGLVPVERLRAAARGSRLGCTAETLDGAASPCTSTRTCRPGSGPRRGRQWDVGVEDVHVAPTTRRSSRPGELVQEAIVHATTACRRARSSCGTRARSTPPTSTTSAASTASSSTPTAGSPRCCSSAGTSGGSARSRSPPPRSPPKFATDLVTLGVKKGELVTFSSERRSD